MTLQRITLGSNIANCDALRMSVRAFGRMEVYGEAFVDALELSVHEAFVNAVVHGNRGDPALPVTVTMRNVPGDEGRRLQVEVADCGPGFSLEGREVFPVNAALSGRGVPIILHYAESAEVERRPEGSLLRLRYIPF
jgi:serine/threonine-protein kinase RsbW